jgi:hypothetical protein
MIASARTSINYLTHTKRHAIKFVVAEKNRAYKLKKQSL